MREAGLSIREDAVGNIFGLLAGDSSAGSPLDCRYTEATLTASCVVAVGACCNKLAHCSDLSV